MTKEINYAKRTCFFVTPIGDSDSKEFKKMTALVNNVINPTIEKYDYETVVAHKIQEIGSIGDQVFTAIKDASLVICDLTGLNPNVMYETAVSHSFGKPTIIIVENDGTKLPFDVSSDRAIFYDDTIEGTGVLIEELDAKIRHIEETSVFDNPVLRVMKQAATLEKIEGSEDIQSQMYRMLIDIQGNLPHPKDFSTGGKLGDIRVLLKFNDDFEIIEINKLIKSTFLNTGYRVKSINHTFSTHIVEVMLIIREDNSYDYTETNYHTENILNISKIAFPEARVKITFRR